MGAGFLPGLIVVAILAAILIYLMQNAIKNLTAEYALGSKS